MVGYVVGKESDTYHNDIMNSYRTKEQVYRGFGMPARTMKDGNIEFLLYDYGSAYRGSRSQIGSVDFYNLNEVQKYVEFTIENNRVINWRTKGVNFGDSSTSDTLSVLGLCIDFILFLSIFDILD